MGEIDGCTMTDVPSITSSLSSRRIDRAPTSPFLSSPRVSFFPIPLLHPTLLVEALSSPFCHAIIALVLITRAVPARLAPRKTTYSDLDFPPV